MEYIVQKAIERLQRFQKENPDKIKVSEEEFLFLCRVMEKTKVNSLRDEDFRISVMVRAERVVIEIEREIKREFENYDKYNKKQADYYTYYFLKNKTDTSKLLCISRPTLDSWIKKGIVSVYEYPNCKRKDIDLRQIVSSLRLVKYS